MSDRIQSRENFRRYVPGYHYVLAGILFVNLILRIVWLVRAPSFGNAWQVVMAVAFGLMFWYLRHFPNRVQDRVIRLEERMRLGRLLPPEFRPRLGEFTPRQLVALRFASDDELPALAERVLNEGITDKAAILALITNWRPDHLRT
ncbi:MAG TPA: DUF6526 family protein [Gemmatimonadales bacterium]|nr:DUF6526 family protein [Gemmatimonadales bacterium]